MFDGDTDAMGFSHKEIQFKLAQNFSDLADSSEYMLFEAFLLSKATDSNEGDKIKNLLSFNEFVNGSLFVIDKQKRIFSMINQLENILLFNIEEKKKVIYFSFNGKRLSFYKRGKAVKKDYKDVVLKTLSKFQGDVVHLNNLTLNDNTINMELFAQAVYELSDTGELSLKDTNVENQLRFYKRETNQEFILDWGEKQEEFIERALIHDFLKQPKETFQDYLNIFASGRSVDLERLEVELYSLEKEGIISIGANVQGTIAFNEVNSEDKVFYFTLQKTKTQVKVKKKKKKRSKEFIVSDDEILSRAKNIIKQKQDTEGIIETFKNLCLPFNGKNPRRDLYLKVFELAGVKAHWDERFGVIVPAKKEMKKTVVSHMDLIPTFNSGFKKGKVCEIDKNKITGALDNTITNAVVFASVLNKQASDTTYLFTLDEETTQFAIRDYMKEFGNDFFVINMDVTDVGLSHSGKKEADVSVEYDEPSWEICKQLSDNLTNPTIDTERECDDFDEVVKAGGYGFSYCIPTGDAIHSYRNWAYIESIVPYYEGLNYLIHDLDVSIKDKNIKHISIKEALSCKTLKKLKKKDKKPKVKTPSYTYKSNFDDKYLGSSIHDHYTHDHYVEDEYSGIQYNSDWSNRANNSDRIAEFLVILSNGDFEDEIFNSVSENELTIDSEFCMIGDGKILQFCIDWDIVYEDDTRSSTYKYNYEAFDDTPMLSVLESAAFTLKSVNFIKLANRIIEYGVSFPISIIYDCYDNKDTEKHLDGKMHCEVIDFISRLTEYSIGEQQDENFHVYS